MCVQPLTHPDTVLVGLMGTSTHFLIPNSSAENLSPQRRSSSTAASLTDSPTTEPSFPPSSPSENSGYVFSSSSSFKLVPEMVLTSAVHEKPRGVSSKKSHKRCVNLDLPNEERCEHLGQRRGSADLEEKKKRCHDKSCCQCVARFTMDCAAVCCCPLALLNLAALTFIRLPTSVVWKMLVKVKNRILPKSRARPSSRDVEEESPRPKFNHLWSYGSSPDENLDLRTFRAKFDTQNLSQHFEAQRLYFGGLSMRKDCGNGTSMHIE